MAKINPIEGLVLPSGAFEHASAVREALQSMIGKVVVINIRQKVKDRSNKQSQYRWAVVVKHVQKKFLDEGEMFEDKEINKFLKRKTGFYYHVKNVAGIDMDVYEETLPQGTAKFEKWMEACRIWAQLNLGITIPLPRESGYFEWVEEQIEKEQNNGLYS